MNSSALVRRALLGWWFALLLVSAPYAWSDQPGLIYEATTSPSANSQELPAPTPPSAPVLQPSYAAAHDPISLQSPSGLIESVASPPALPQPSDSLSDADTELLNSSAISGPRWYYPWTWVPLKGWANSAELGINGSSGNANSFSIQAGTRFKRKSAINNFDLRLTHNRTQSGGIEKQNNALMYVDFDRYFGDSPWTAFVKNGLEYDRFKAFDLRFNVNVGLGYSFIKSENLTWKGRFGSGTSREFGGPEDRWVPEALFGADYEHQWNKRNKWIARVDYFPEWGNFSNYRIVSDASWEMLWDEAGNLSFKVGAIDRYDSTPNGRQPNDLTYSMLLLYKF